MLSAVTSRLSVEFHLNENTLQARHCLTANPLRYHDGFTPSDSEAGWKQVMAFGAEGTTDDEIESQKLTLVERHRTFWLELLDQFSGNSIICDGHHYVSHDLGSGMGFYGEAFRVDWLDTTRPPLVCNLSTQGPIPGWLRPQLPDNATITNLDYLLDERPVLSRRRIRRHLIAAGLRPSEASAFLREHDERRYYSRESHYWPSRTLRDLMKRKRRHAARWFPLDVAIA